MRSARVGRRSGAPSDALGAAVRRPRLLLALGAAAGHLRLAPGGGCGPQAEPPRAEAADARAGSEAFASAWRGGAARGAAENAARAAPRPRRVARRQAELGGVEVEKHFRLPVWPAWFGVFYILLDLVTGNPKLGARLEDWIGGRVCPMMFSNPTVADPYLLVVHHRHSFNVLDPLRYVFRNVLMPEGFPAHAHRGFETVTYCLRGGLVHRDSFGIKKSYGAPPGSDGSGEGAAVQWMTAGRGLRHEEMWRTGGAGDSTDQELFQIWVNLPARAKMVPPRMQMLREATEQELGEAAGGVPGGGGVRVDELGPVPKAQPGPGVTVRVVAGEACGVRSPVETHSALAILHVTLEPGASWSWPRPQGWTCLAYMRRGEGAVNGRDVAVHETATVSRRTGGLALEAGSEGADLLLLSGRPLDEPVEMGGNIVMNTGLQLQEAQRDQALGRFGPQWAHEETDASWRGIVAAHWGGGPGP